MANWQLFIRHAHRDINRDTVDRDLDNGLSDKGRLQAEELVKYLKLSHPDRKPLRVLSSVKLRCWQTAEYVARWAGVEVIEDPRLVERRPSESEKDFLARVGQFVMDSAQERSTCYVSHGDVLPAILALLGEGSCHIRKGELFWVVNRQVEEINAVQKSGIKP